MLSVCKTLNYLLGDYSLVPRDKLGSQSAQKQCRQAITTNTSGARTGEIRYYPWGTERYTWGTTPTTFHYTGQRLESALGLYFYGARWYDSVVGRFTSADSIIPIPSENPEDIRQIQLSLIVDYHETFLLSQLNKMYSEELTKKPISSEKQSNNKNTLNIKTDYLDPLQDEADEEDNSLENLEPIKINTLSDIGKSQSKEKSEENIRERQAFDAINLQPYQLNLASLDRFAYVSNCPTSYTDPSGHCTPLIAGFGTAFTAIGGVIFTAGVWGIKTSLAAIPADPLHAIEAAGISSIIAVGGGLLAYGGSQILISNDCIP